MCDDAERFLVGDWVVVALALVFFLGNVAASVVSCCQTDALAEKLVEQDARTSAVVDAAPASSVGSAGGSSSSINNTGANAPPGVIVTSFNEV